MKRALSLGVVAALLLPACAANGDRTEVFAASSLGDVFSDIEPDAVYNFAGSDELATQIDSGATPDVYASASVTQADRLAELDLIDDPLPFATNELVIVVPKDDPAAISTWRDLARPGIRLVIGADGVPAGDYAREAILELNPTILDNVVSEEQDVRAVLAKVALGEADAGFVYATDVAAASADVVQIGIPETAQPAITYVIAQVVSGDEERAAGFIELVLSETGRWALVEAGFGLP